jgi:hypothetical protein
MSDKLTLSDGPPESVVGRYVRMGQEELLRLQARAQFLLVLPSDCVVLDPLRRRAMERVLRCADWEEVWDEDEEMVDDVWEATEREFSLRGEKWEGGGL